MDDNDFIARLRHLLDAENVLTALTDRVFFSTDIFTQGTTADAIIVPPSIELLVQAIRLCTENERIVIPRGGGFSYTQGYIPIRAATVIVDLRRLDRILEINADDLYVTVECGCTWARLYNALKEKGLRTPYFGPMSGYRATVGGALSQGSFFLGSTQYGTTADTVLGLDVVLADGTLVSTGSAACIRQTSPHFRNYGPDLTGLFLHDAGALGFKASATLKLIPFPKHHRFATFAFADGGPAIAALSDIARGGLAAECYIWDPAFGASLSGRNALLDDMRYLGGVFRSGNHVLAGLANSIRLVAAGKEAFDGKAYLLHVTIDDVSDAGAEGKLKLVNAIGSKRGGRAMEPSAPRALRGMPFNDFAPMAESTPQQRNLPTHGIFPHSKLIAMARKTRDYFEDNKAEMVQNGITSGTIIFAIGANAVCIEPLMYWTDPQLALHNRLTDRTDVEALARMPERPTATKAVAKLRAGLIALFAENGASHCQIGKAYPYRETRKPETYHLLEAIKQAVDPHARMNPGALGLSSPAVP